MDLGAQVPDLKDALPGTLVREPAVGAPIPVNNWLEDCDEHCSGTTCPHRAKLMTRDPLVLTFPFA